MSRSPGRQRAKALLLLLVLLVGGFGLPIVDGLWFHSTARAPVATHDALGTADESGTTHLLGCAVWSSPATSTGLPCVPQVPAADVALPLEPPALLIAVLATQVTATLALPRAPPSA